MRVLDEAALDKITGADGKLDPRKLSALVRDYAEQCFRERGAGAESGGGRLSPLLPMADLERAGWPASRVLAQIASTDDAPGRGLDRAFKSFGHFAAAISPESVRYNGVPSALRDIRADLTEGVGGDGGFLVPEEFRGDLLIASLEKGIVRQRATVVPMASASVKLPAIRDTSHASGLFGVTFSWTAEGASIAEDQPVFQQVVLTARKLAGYTEVTNETLADSPISVDTFLGEAFSEGLAFEEDYAFLRGTGVGEPLGVLNADALIVVAKETGQAASTILWENIVNIWSRVLPASQQWGVWVAAPDTFPQLATMSLSVGTGGSAIWLQNGSGSAPPSILGRPLIFSEKAPSLGSEGDIGFYDFRYYLLGDRQQMTLASSPHFRFQNDLTAYRLVERVDGRPWVTSAVTPRNSGSTLSPFVTLAERA